MQQGIKVSWQMLNVPAHCRVLALPPLMQQHQRHLLVPEQAHGVLSSWQLCCVTWLFVRLTFIVIAGRQGIMPVRWYLYLPNFEGTHVSDG